MSNTEKRDFDSLAANWDDNPGRAALAKRLAAAVIEKTSPQKNWTALDYGAGTGLVTLILAEKAGTIYAADSSEGMLAKLVEKVEDAGLKNVFPAYFDIAVHPLPELKFDLIVSTMAMHHIEDVFAAILKLSSLLAPGGKLAVADLDLDDGEFHADKTGIMHDGFDREDMKRFFTASGLENISIDTAAEFEKEVKGKGLRNFSVFLCAGSKPARPRPAA